VWLCRNQHLFLPSRYFFHGHITRRRRKLEPAVLLRAYLTSFILALGAIIVAWRGGYETPATRYTPAMPLA
jgi:uncharacterized membrane protein YdfJ with MMPL/SSD domain